MNVNELGIKKDGFPVKVFLTNVFQLDVSFDPPSLGASITAESSSIPFPGVRFGDRVVIYPPTTHSTKGVSFTGYVDAEDSVKIISHNPTAATVGLDSGTFTIQAFRK